jgi:hypothetical protein
MCGCAAFGSNPALDPSVRFDGDTGSHGPEIRRHD